MVLATQTPNAFDPLEAHGETDQKAYYRLRATALGTHCQILFAAPSHRMANQFRDQAGEWLESFEARYSRFRPESLISRINRLAANHPVPIDDELDSLFRLCDWFHWTTQGRFDPTMMPLNQLWGFTPDAQTDAPRPSDNQVAEARQLVDWKAVTRADGAVHFAQPGMGIDLGGIGKEYAVDRVTEMAIELGIQDVLVDFGHDVRAHGSPPEGGAWRIGLEDPQDPGRCYSGAALHNRAIATSGNYLRFRQYDDTRFGHLIDPRTGFPVSSDCLAVSVVAPTCTEAGILASCAFMMGSDEALPWLRGFHQCTASLITQRATHKLPGFKCLELGNQAHPQAPKEATQ
jgi:thiamine biosynthesis lipoprotein